MQGNHSSKSKRTVPCDYFVIHGLERKHKTRNKEVEDRLNFLYESPGESPRMVLFVEI